MAEEPTIADDELVLRHIPGGLIWQAVGPRVTSANFSLRTERNETGVSVSRLNLTSAEQLLHHVKAEVAAGSRVAAARVGNVRALGLVVVPKPMPHDLGHSEIQSGSASLTSRAVRRKLADLFQFLDADK